MTDLFRHPFIMILVLLFTALLCLFAYFEEKKRNGLTLRVLGPNGGPSGKVRFKRRLRDFCLIGAVFFTGTALCGPQWGVKLSDMTDLRGSLVVAVDASLSMAARDLKPNRMENARMLVESITEKFSEYRLGLIAFAGRAYLECPLTNDLEALRYFSSILSPGMLPVQGTDFEDAIELSMKVMQKQAGNKILVLITDGENHSSNLEMALKEAREHNLKIFTVGLGSLDGELIPNSDSHGNVLDYKKDPKTGKPVVSRLNEKVLAQIARETGAGYIYYNGPEKVADEILKAVNNISLQKTGGMSSSRYKDRYQWPLAAAIILLLMEMLITDKPMFPARVRRTAALFFMFFLPVFSSGLSAAGYKDLNNKGNEAYKKEAFDEALQFYELAKNKKPDDEVLEFNKGTALYSLGKLDEAASSFEKTAKGTESVELKEKALFNRGNALFKKGDLKEAAMSYRKALKINPKNGKALYNLQICLKTSDKKCDKPKDNKGGGDKKDQNKDKDSKQPRDGAENKDSGSKKQDEEKKEERKEQQNQMQQLLDMMKEKEKEARQQAKQVPESSAGAASQQNVWEDW